MAARESDRERWDRKYAAGEGPAHFEPHSLLTEYSHLLQGERALDVACGFGGNALYLAARGYRVDAVDASGVALVRARTEAMRRSLALNLIQADLDRWQIQLARYDLVLVFFYLNRGLMPQLATGLKPGGLLFQANRNWRYLATRPGFDPAYLMGPGELRRLALNAGLEVLHYDQKGHTSELIARRPT
jgi:tellurite methyltransferase